MRPGWFAVPPEFRPDGCVLQCDLGPIPQHQMWEDDYLWMPSLLSRTFFVGRVDFSVGPEAKQFKMKKWWIGTPSAGALLATPETE